MNKKFLSFVLAVVLVAPCMIFLSACSCGEVEASNITIENMFVGERKVDYEYGTSINDIISTNIKVTAIFPDNTTKVLEASEYTIEYKKNDVVVQSFKPIPDVGYYTITVKYKEMSESNTFNIVPTYKSPYTISLTKNSWTYGDDLPEIALTNYDLKKGETVTWKYVEKSVYDNLTEIEKANHENYAAFWSNSILNVYAGEYYVFGVIHFVDESNYTGMTKIDSNCLIRVHKKDIQILNDVISEYNYSTTPYNYSSSINGDYFLGNIKLGDISIAGETIYLETNNGGMIQGYLVWANPEQKINVNNNGQFYPVKFEPNNIEDSENYNFIYNLSLQVHIQKGIVGNLETMNMKFEQTGSNTIEYDGNEHSLVLENFNIINYGGEISNAVTFTDKNGENVKVRYEETTGGLVSMYIDGLREIGEYVYTVTILDTTNYAWSDGSTKPHEFIVTITDSTNLLNVEGNYQNVYPDTEGETDPQPKYMQYMGKWMKIGMETTAPDYNAEIQIYYKDVSNAFKITGTVNNKYTDVATYNDFTTNTNLTDGIDNYVISGKVDTNGTNNEYTINKNGESEEFVINESLSSLIMTALRIDIANIAISGDTQIFSVAEDSSYLKLKIENQNSDNSMSVVYYVFDNEGELVGYKVSMQNAENTMSYSIQVKFVK